MRRLLLLLTAFAVLVPSGVAAGAPAPERHTNIVDGDNTSISQLPYQVALLDGRPRQSPGISPWKALFCGGIVLNATHILTAGHCGQYILDQLDSASGLLARVQSGRTTLSTSASTTLTGTTKVARVDLHPDFDPASLTNDVAVLALSTSLPNYNVDAKPVSLPPAGPPGATPLVLQVSGWGDTRVAQGCLTDPNSTYACYLQRAYVGPSDKTSCLRQYDGGFVKNVTYCAAYDGTDACQGDSGGPLVDPGNLATPSDVSDDVLVGVVSSGLGCADPNYPGLYADVAAEPVRSFIIAELGGPAYTGHAEHPGLATVSGAPVVGTQMSCAASGTTPGSRPSFYVFTLNGIPAQQSSRSTFVPRPEHAGGVVGCTAVVEDSAGAYAVKSAVTGPVTFAPVVPQPRADPPPATTPTIASPTTTTTAPSGAPETAGSPPAPRDEVAPKARLASMRCTRTRCTLRLTVTDPTPSAGLLRIDVRVLSRTGKVARTIRVTVAAGRWQVVLTRPRTGRTALRLIAVDKAGNRQDVATAVAVRAAAR